MTNVLLTGAGFSRNWGGWLASEAFEYLLGCTEIDEETRRLLWRSNESGGGFENTLADLATAKDDRSKKRLKDLTDALVGMFNAMGHGFEQLTTLEFKNPPEVHYMVKTFLDRFQAIFTLNQDTLLERHYLNILPGGCRCLGLKSLNPGVILPQQSLAGLQQPDPPFNLDPTFRPYIKLHGSCNWMEGTFGDRILIMGGQKNIAINQFPILSWYQPIFKECLSRPDARLMVIGYSFSDEHINAAIGQAIEHGLKVFIIDPCGVDVLDKRQKEPVGRTRDEYMKKLASHIIGASRRPLTSTFGDDKVEHARIMKFFST